MLTGTRADYGLLRPVCREIQARDGLELRLIVTGQHLAREFGATGGEIERDGFPIAARVDMLLRADTGAAMAKSLALCLLGLTQVLEEIVPDFLVVLGDRGEMLAGAIAAAHMGIAVAHLHGGELSGSIDDSLRHAITKLAHLHFPVTDDAVRCLVASGEQPARIHKIGAPGLDTIAESFTVSDEELAAALGTVPRPGFILTVFHPVVEEGGESMAAFAAMLAALVGLGRQILLFLPNADAGREAILQVLGGFALQADLLCLPHVARRLYLGLLVRAAVMVGNSSSGILEAPSFGLPVVNIGNRQRGRLRGNNVSDVGGNAEEIGAAVRAALARGDSGCRAKGLSAESPYRGGGAKPFVDVLATIPLDGWLLRKDFTFGGGLIPGGSGSEVDPELIYGTNDRTDSITCSCSASVRSG